MLTVEQDTPAMATYRATGMFKDGRSEDVTNRVVFAIDGRFGHFDGPRFTSTTQQGGRTMVQAMAGAVVGKTPLTLRLRKQISIGGSGAALPSAPAMLFGGTSDAGRKPDLVYPSDGVTLPPNLGRLEFHFRPGSSANTLYRLSFKSGSLEMDVYTRCQPLADGCLFEASDAVWRALAETHRGALAPVEVRVAGTDDTGSSHGVSDVQTLQIAADDIRGGIYYWTTSGTTGIMRYDFGAPAMMPTKFVGPEQTSSGTTCIGCHVISRDGKKLIAAAGTPLRGEVLLFDVARRAPIVPFGQPPQSLFSSWGPDGGAYVGVWGELDATDFNLLLFDGNTGAQTGTIAVGGTRDNPANHPDWSEDGNAIAFVRVGIRHFNGSNPRLQEMYKGQIELVRKQNGNWSSAQVVVPAADGKNRYYPAFAPDSKFLVFCESTCPSGNAHKDCNAAMDPSAKIYAVLAETGKTPVELTALNRPGKADGMQAHLTNSFPKWSPFEFQRGYENGSRLMWLTFSSTRRYGLRAAPAPGGGGSGENASGSLLWMVAIDPDKVARGEDPSSAAFALPFQDLATSNHIAQWTTRVIPTVQ